MVKRMTKSEEQVMTLLWRSEKPLSCSEIVALSENKTWKDSYVHSLIKSLIKKGIVKIESFELVSRSYARKFVPKISYHEYVLLSYFSEERLKDVGEMSEFIRLILSYSNTPRLKEAVREIVS